MGVRFEAPFSRGRFEALDYILVHDRWKNTVLNVERSGHKPGGEKLIMWLYLGGVNGWVWRFCGVWQL
eukprot:9274028-Prorocentrum_lima.AAC.1